MNTDGGMKRMREWLRAQGDDVADRGQISADRKARYYAAHPGEVPAGWVEPIPGPDAGDEEFEDLGVMEPAPETGMPADGPQSDGERTLPPRTYRAVPGDGEPLTADPGPAHATKQFRRRTQAAGRKQAGRVTPAIRGDIAAKIEFALTLPGAIWQARDPVCGGTFVAQTPDITIALTDIVCESADLVAFFSGPGGAFMRYLALGAALMPVGQAVMAHHVYHTLDQAPDMMQPDYQPDYAA